MGQGITERRYSATLVYAAFVAGLCSIIYELLIATTVSYFLGDGVKYFSLTIGLYMAAMGLGSFLSKYMDERLLHKFLYAELCLGVLGGLSVPMLYFAYAYDYGFIAIYVFFTLGIGFLIGLEIPFLTRLLETRDPLKTSIANILSFDYFGALIATVAFPFLLLPFFGVYQTSLLFGLINLSIAFVMLWVFRAEFLALRRVLWGAALMLAVGMGAMMIFSSIALRHWDQQLYSDRIVFSKQTRYQRIVLTKSREDVRLFLDGNLQFSSTDEYRYHEALVHVPFAVSPAPIRRVLLLGAGDGLAVRELLKHSSLKQVTVVDLDAEIIRLARESPYVRELNRNSLANPKVHVVTGDAFTFLKKNSQLFDLIIADLPDPNNNELARLYSKQFYTLLRLNLAPKGLFVTQATSPYFATDAFWSIAKTIEAAGFAHNYPYHADVPSFGDWGFVLASFQPLEIARPEIAVPTRYLDHENFASLFVFDKDNRVRDVEVNQLDRPSLLSYYLNGWRNYAN